MMNGRININDSKISNKTTMFHNIKTNDCCSYDEALTGTLECSFLSKAFFSKENMQIIQNSIRASVYEISNKQHVIAQQDIVNLKIIMRAIYLQYTRNNKSNITQQITDLNNIIVEKCVSKILTELDAYIKYKNDVSTLVVPLERPTQTNYKYKTNEFKRFF